MRAHAAGQVSDDMHLPLGFCCPQRVSEFRREFLGKQGRGFIAEIPHRSKAQVSEAVVALERAIVGPV